MTREDWIKVCRVLHAAEIYTSGAFDAYGSLCPDGGGERGAAVGMNRRGWDRVLGVLAANEVIGGPLREPAWSRVWWCRARRYAERWYEMRWGEPL